MGLPRMNTHELTHARRAYLEWISNYYIQSINQCFTSFPYIYIFKNQIEILLDQDSEISSNNV